MISLFLTWYYFCIHLYVTIYMKIDSNIHIVMHLVFFGKIGVTHNHRWGPYVSLPREGGVWSHSRRVSIILWFSSFPIRQIESWILLTNLGLHKMTPIGDLPGVTSRFAPVGTDPSISTRQVAWVAECKQWRVDPTDPLEPFHWFKLRWCFLPR
jgi:hypothetical protein